MRPDYDELVLDDPGALEAGDRGQLLRAAASAGAQVRTARRLAEEAGVRGMAAESRPRAILVAGMGESGVCADVLAATCGTAASVPVLPLRGFVLPGWVGAMDLVLAVSCSGTTEETLTVADEAVRRGCRLVTVGRAGTPLAEVSVRGRGLHLPVDDAGRPPRANVWAQSVPLLLVADALGLVATPDQLLERLAARLDALAVRYGPAVPAYENPAKQLALELGHSVPVVWGSSEVAEVAAYRFACQLNENAKLPAVFGSLPEAGHNQIVALDGPLAGAGEGGGEGDFFRDRLELSAAWRMRLVLLRDAVEHPRVAARADVVRALADERGVAVSEVVAGGEHPVERLAEFMALTDFASIYLALCYGLDPEPITPIVELKERTRR